VSDGAARVLLVEDTAPLAVVCTGYLRAAGHAAEHARNAEEALRLARAKPPDAARLIRQLSGIGREAIERAVEICDGNIPKAAAHLGISPSTRCRKRAAWGAGAE
jgi:DNA-binding NtrC family response regulator